MLDFPCCYGMLAVAETNPQQMQLDTSEAPDCDCKTLEIERARARRIQLLKEKVRELKLLTLADEVHKAKPSCAPRAKRAPRPRNCIQRQSQRLAAQAIKPSYREESAVCTTRSSLKVRVSVDMTEVPRTPKDILKDYFRQTKGTSALADDHEPVVDSVAEALYSKG